MVEKGRKKGTVRFVIRPDGAVRRASLAGSFNGWKPTQMRRQKNGAFVVIVAVPPGTYEYKFIVDDQWAVDPDNNVWAVNPFGTINSILSVE